MSSSDPGNKQWTLKQEIRKRKTQQIIRDLEAKQLSQPIHPRPTSKSTRSLQDAASRRTTQETRLPVAPAKPARSAGNPAGKRTTQVAAVPAPIARRSAVEINPFLRRWSTLSIGRRQKLIAAVGVAVILVTCVSATLIAGNQAPQGTRTPTAVPLPVASASDAVDYLKRAGVPVLGLQQLTVPSKTWNAYEGILFSTASGNDRAQFIIVSYDSPANASLDAYRTKYTDPFNKWTLNQIANMLVLASPGSSQSLQVTVTKYLTRGFIAPFRSFVADALK